uniref:Uncharacterized protein n=1 Tax=Peronospora matthiolae TaxID=2874970 RepID=A0AAV1UPZ2_9STRA
MPRNSGVRWRASQREARLRASGRRPGGIKSMFKRTDVVHEKTQRVRVRKGHVVGSLKKYTVLHFARGSRASQTWCMAMGYR